VNRAVVGLVVGGIFSGDGLEVAILSVDLGPGTFLIEVSVFSGGFMVEESGVETIGNPVFEFPVGETLAVGEK